MTTVSYVDECGWAGGVWADWMAGCRASGRGLRVLLGWKRVGGLLRGAVVVGVQDDEGGGDDRGDASWVEADVAQRFERHLEQGVAAFGDGPDPVVDLVEVLLGVGEL